MKDYYTTELKKLYDDNHVCLLLQEVCEYYSSLEDYEDGSYEDEIEPRKIVEPVYTLFILQRRETMLDEMAYIGKHYPSLFSAISKLYNNILIHMDVCTLEKETAESLSLALDEKFKASQLTEKIEELADNYDELSEALDQFYGWIHRTGSGF